MVDIIIYDAMSSIVDARGKAIRKKDQDNVEIATIPRSSTVRLILTICRLSTAATKSFANR